MGLPLPSASPFKSGCPGGPLGKKRTWSRGLRLLCALLRALQLPGSSASNTNGDSSTENSVGAAEKLLRSCWAQDVAERPSMEHIIEELPHILRSVVDVEHGELKA